MKKGRIKSQKGVEVIFSKIKEANHFFKDKENIENPGQPYSQRFILSIEK